MKHLLISAAAVAIMSSAATAADLPIYEPAPMVAPAPSAAFDWSGIYVGGHGGYGWGDLDAGDDDGIVAGGQIGINWNWNSFVIGAEGDGSWADIDGVDSLASLRLRAGFGIDRLLVYGTGGAAFEDFDELGWVAGGGAEIMLTQNVSLGAEYLHYEFDEDAVDVIRGRVNVKFNSLFGGY